MQDIIVKAVEVVNSQLDDKQFKSFLSAMAKESSDKRRKIEYSNESRVIYFCVGRDSNVCIYKESGKIDLTYKGTWYGTKMLKTTDFSSL